MLIGIGRDLAEQSSAMMTPPRLPVDNPLLVMRPCLASYRSPLEGGSAFSTKAENSSLWEEVFVDEFQRYFRLDIAVLTL